MEVDIRPKREHQFSICACATRRCRERAHEPALPRRTFLLPAQRCLNQPFALRLKPIQESDNSIRLFEEGTPEVPPGFPSFEGLAYTLAEAERESNGSLDGEIQYTAAAQITDRVVCFVTVGDVGYVKLQSGPITDVFWSVIARSVAGTGTAMCVAVHAALGRSFLRDINRERDRKRRCAGLPLESAWSLISRGAAAQVASLGKSGRGI